MSGNPSTAVNKIHAKTAYIAAIASKNISATNITIQPSLSTIPTTIRRDRGQSLGHRRAFDMIRSAISTMMPTKNSFTNITFHSLSTMPTTISRFSSVVKGAF